MRKAGQQHFLLFPQFLFLNLLHRNLKMFESNIFCMWKCFQFVQDDVCYLLVNPFPNDKFWILPKLKEFAADNFKSEENGGKFPKG